LYSLFIAFLLDVWIKRIARRTIQ